MTEPNVVPWWRPDRFARRRPYLETRQAIAKAVRAYFAAEGFAEVETPALQVSPGLEVHLKAFGTSIEDPAGGMRPLFLHTSPEFAMKKLLAAGEPRLFQLARTFRNGERSATHHPEFTMLEWYRAGERIEALWRDCEALLRAALAAVPVRRSLSFEEREADPSRPFERLSVAAAFERHAGIDLLATTPDPTAPDVSRLARDAARIGIACQKDDGWEDIFFRIFLARIEPELGIDVPTILYDYPASMAALARLKPGEPRVAERFEIYVAGLELANGFAELTDAREQRRRFELDIAKKQALYGVRYPIDEDFLAALEHGMPEASGIALGFDRLVMLATGAPSIDDVLWAPVA